MFLSWSLSRAVSLSGYYMTMRQAVSLDMLPLRMAQEWKYLSLPLESLQSPSRSSCIPDYVSLSLSSALCLSACHRLDPLEQNRSTNPSATTSPVIVSSVASRACGTPLPLLDPGFFLSLTTLFLERLFWWHLLVAASIFNQLTFATGLHGVQHLGLYTWLCVLYSIRKISWRNPAVFVHMDAKRVLC